MKTKIFSLVAAIVLVLAIGSQAKADTIETFTQGSYSGTLDVGTTSMTLTLGGPSSGFFVYEVAVMIAGTATSDGTGSASSGSWSFLNSQNPNTCGTGQQNNWFCADTPGAQAGNGLQLTWNFTGTPGSEPYSLHFIICDTQVSCTQGDENFVTIFSQTGTGQVPEASSLTLIGVGLLGMAGLGLMRRKVMA